MIQELMRSYTGNLPLLVISGIAFLIGYIEYIYSFRLVIRERSAPYPIWMHTFYFAHDFTGAVVFFRLAQQYDGFWFFAGAAIALLIWNCFEIFNIYMAVQVERQEIWGAYYDAPVTARQALLRVIGQILLMFAIVNALRIMMNDEVMFKLFLLTNVLMAFGPGYLWNQRRSRRGSSVGLSLVIFIGTVNTFLPPGWGMWTTALSYFDQPWFYAVGVTVSAFALRNVVLLLRYPPKVATDGRRPIW